MITACIALFAASCKKTPNTPPQPMVSYQMKAINTSYTVARTTAGANIVWTSAIAWPDKVTFTAKQDNNTVTFTSTNKDAIDLLAPAPVSFGGFVLPTGTYDKIALKIDLDKTGTTPILTMNGSLTTATTTYPVSLVVTNSMDLTTEEQNVTITNDADYVAVTTIDLSELTSGITTDMLLNADLSNGTILISATTNRGLYGIVVDHLEHKHHHCEFERHHH